MSEYLVSTVWISCIIFSKYLNCEQYTLYVNYLCDQVIVTCKCNNVISVMSKASLVLKGLVYVLCEKSSVLDF